MTLRELGIGKSAIIESVGGEGALRQHFLDMGLVILHSKNISRFRKDDYICKRKYLEFLL